MLKLESKEELHPSNFKIEFVPLFPGIFIDFDTDTSIDECDKIIGETGLSSEFFFKKNKLSKIFVEFPSNDVINHLSKNEALDLLDHLEKYDDLKTIFALDYPNSIKRNPQIDNTIISNDLSFSIFFFDTFQEEMFQESTIQENFEIFKLNPQVSIGIDSETGELYMILIKNYLDNFWIQDLTISKENIGELRMNSLIKLAKKSFDTGIDKEKFAILVDSHNSQTNLKKNDASITKAEQLILNSFLKLNQ